MTALVNLIIALLWPSLVLLGGWYFREELKTALKRITEIGLGGAKFALPPEQQIPSSPSTVAAQELPAPKSDAAAPKHRRSPLNNKVSAQSRPRSLSTNIRATLTLQITSPATTTKVITIPN